jgi:hypothetical protein
LGTKPYRTDALLALLAPLNVPEDPL